MGKKGEPVCIDDEIPFGIPDNWEWVRINTIHEVYTGNSINKTEKEIQEDQIGKTEEEKEPRKFENLFDDKGNLK